MARHDNEPRILELPKRLTKEQKLLYIIIVLQVIGIIVYFIKI